MADVGWQMADVRSQISVVGCQMLDVRSGICMLSNENVR
jgi:hypothetical protein